MSEDKYNQNDIDGVEGMSYDEMEKGKEEALNQLRDNIKQQDDLNGEEYNDIVIEHHSEEEGDYEDEVEVEDEEEIDEEQDNSESKDKEDNKDLEEELEYSSEATGIDLYYSGELYNSEENIVKREEEKHTNTDEGKRPTKTTDVSSINLDVILNHVNNELKNKGIHHLIYYMNINYSVGRFEDSFLTEVNAWIKYRSILKNGKGENDNTHLVTIPLGEEDMMMFDGTQDANEYLGEIGAEDMEIKSKGIEDFDGLKYIHFHSEINDRIIKEEFHKYKEYINGLSDEEYNNILGDNFNDKGELDYKVEVPEEDKKELDEIRGKEKEEEEIKEDEVRQKNGSGDNTEDDSVLSQDDMSPEPEYIKVSVEDVITQLRKRDIAMGGTHQYVDRKHEELKQQGVTDVYLKDILFEYEWDRLAELNNVSRLIYFYYDLELVTSRGIISDRYSLKVPLDMLFKGEDIYYVSKGQFKDLIVNTESLVDEFKKEDYFRYLYKGIAVYLGTKGGKQYKEYIKDNGIKKVKEDEPKLGNRNEQKQIDIEDADEVNNLEDMAELVRRMYQDVHTHVEDTKLKKAYEMFNIFLRKAQKEYKGRISVQPHTKFKGLWVVTAEGGNILNAVNIGDGTREKNKKREEHLILHPFFAIASNGDNVSRVIYKRRTTNMSLGDYESMLIYNGYDELTDIAKFMNLKNYSKVIGFNNRFLNDTTKAFGRQATRATGRAMWKGSVWAGRKLIGSDKKRRRY